MSEYTQSQRDSQRSEVHVKQAEFEGGGTRHNDLDDLAGKCVDDPEFDKAMEAMDKIDEGLWQ